MLSISDLPSKLLTELYHLYILCGDVLLRLYRLYFYILQLLPDFRKSLLCAAVHDGANVVLHHCYLLYDAHRLF